MIRFDEHFIRSVISQVSFFGNIPTDIEWSVDSRSVSERTLFVALHGGRYDGHDYVVDACKNGACGALVSHDKLAECRQLLEQYHLKSVFLIAVPDPKDALIALATAWRKQFSIPIIGITGSVGKTSCKESIAHLFKHAGKQYIASYGNQNTLIGVALNILRLRSQHEVGLFEMGINRRGEMALLAKMVKPTIGIITAIGHSHMEGLGSLQDIAAEKRDIFKYFTEKNIGIVNGDQPLSAMVSYPHPIIKFGSKTTNQIQMRKVRIVDGCTRCILKVYKAKYNIILNNPHAGAITSALVAGAVSHILDISHTVLCESIQEPLTIPGRFEQRLLRNGRGAIISDCYNASPESVKASLMAFQTIGTAAYKTVVLGDMLELGVNSPFWHRQIGRFFRKAPSLKRVILVGDMVQWVEKTLPLGIIVERVQTWQQAAALLDIDVPTQEQLILVKGSNGVGLLNLVDQCAL